MDDAPALLGLQVAPLPHVLLIPSQIISDLPPRRRRALVYVFSPLTVNKQKTNGVTRLVV